MQNKPNLLNAQMNITSVNTMNYELRTMNYFMQNKANSNPIKPNFKADSPKTNPIKANQTQFQTTPAQQFHNFAFLALFFTFFHFFSYPLYLFTPSPHSNLSF